jgi:hypothetical protein
MMRVKVEKEFAIIIRGDRDVPDFEAGRVKAFSEDHAIHLGQKAGFRNIGQALNVEGRLYQRFCTQGLNHVFANC